MPSVRLKLINESTATNPTIAVTCMDSSSAGGALVAWRLIRNLRPGSFHPFAYSPAMDITVADSNGNYTPPQPAELGDVFTMVDTSAGHQLQRTSGATQPLVVGVRNAVHDGPIRAYFMRNELVFMQMESIYPNAQAAFRMFPNVIFIGKAQDIQEGSMSTTIEFDGVPTQINLFNFNSADIVMRGDDSELSFTLENIH